MIRTGIKVDMDVSELVANASRANVALQSLDIAMNQAMRAGDWEKYTALAMDKEKATATQAKMETGFGALSQDVISGKTSIIKVDQEYSSLLRNQIEAMKNLQKAWTDSIASGDYKAARKVQGLIDQQADDMLSPGIPPRTPNAQGGIMAGLGKGLSIAGIGIMAGSIASALIRSMDKAAIVRSLAGGDVIGSEIQDIRRKGQVAEGIGKPVLATIAGGIGLALGGPGGMLFGAGLGNMLGGFVSKPFEATAVKKQTAEAEALAWLGSRGFKLYGFGSVAWKLGQFADGV